MYQKRMEQTRDRRIREEYRKAYNEIREEIENITRTANTRIIPLQLMKGLGAVIGFMIGAATFVIDLLTFLKEK